MNYQKSIETLSIKQRTSIRNRIVISMYLFILFIIFPISLIQELFLVPRVTMLPITDLIFWEALWGYFNKHYITHTYIILLITSALALFFLLRPYTRYIMTGNGKENIVKKTLFPEDLLLCFLIIPNLCNIINVVLDYQYFLSLPINSLVCFIILKIVWQILCCILTLFFFFSINAPMRNTLGMYSFDPKSRIFFAISKEFFLLILQLTVFFVILIEMFSVLDGANITKENAQLLHYTLSWGFLLFMSCNFFVNILLLYQQKVNNNIKSYIYNDVKNIVNSGNLNIQSTYYEQNMLGSFTSEYNRFIDSLKNNIYQIQSAVKTLNKENTVLCNDIGDLITKLNNQEENVFQMNLATNKTNSTVQYLLREVEEKYSLLTTEENTIQLIMNGTNNITNTFNLITQEHILGKQSTKEALVAVRKSLEKEDIMNKHIINIHHKIKKTGQETAAIDEVLHIIKKISEQTSLLSMSAAIEAAHGDSSSRQGFTLVAEEIRKLAHISQDSVDKIATRLSIINEHINSAYHISNESISLSHSSLKTCQLLETSITKIADTSVQLNKFTQEAEPITLEQQQLVTTFQGIILTMKDFLQKLVLELKNESSTSVLMSLNFRTMMNNCSQSRTAIYYIETSINRLAIIEKHLEQLVNEFSLAESQHINK